MNENRSRSKVECLAAIRRSKLKLMECESELGMVC
jgi:hypothetical protein